jgi:CubicO group peptidase (beta-lactamase class C family)
MVGCMMKNRITLLIALSMVFVLLKCIPNDHLKTNFDVDPVQLLDGWEIATAEEVGLYRPMVMEAYEMYWDEDAFYNAKSLLIVRYGKLVFENYCRDVADRDIKGHIQSATKSITSLSFGVARDQGYFPNIDTLLYDIMPEKFDDDTIKQKISMRHLLTMKSGIAFDNDDWSIEMLINKPADPIRYTLAKPMYAAPGDSFYYRDCDPQLVSSAIERVTDQRLEEIARDNIFTPLGIADYFWEANSEGTTLGPVGLFLKPRDLAKIGKLVAQDGAWEGQQLISQDWVLMSTTTQTAVPGPENYGYGYYWWVVPEVNGFTVWGAGGQFVFILPQYDIIIVMTSMPSTNDDKVGTTLSEFLPIVETIIASVIQ